MVRIYQKESVQGVVLRNHPRPPWQDHTLTGAGLAGEQLIGKGLATNPKEVGNIITINVLFV